MESENLDISDIRKINEYEWEIPKRGKMRVPGLVFSDENGLIEMDEEVRRQIINVATLPGIQKASIAMPDAHWGYGFPIGGVAAFEPENGVISVGGVGFDCNCGVRTLLTKVKYEEILPYLEEVANLLFERIPAGLGSEGKIKLDISTLDEVLEHGAHWAVEFGYGHSRDLEYTEERGRIKTANPAYVSDKAKRRELRQLGTLGSGNHYLEIQHVSEIYDEKTANVFGLELNDVVVSLHTGSRALGHQVGSDYLSVMARAAVKYGIEESLREKELASAPINSDEGQAYFGAICAAFNLAFANRQVITHLVREVFVEIGIYDMPLLYDVGHNTCKIEEHNIDGEIRKLYVHRKGATRAFGPGSEDLPERYRGVGQPVLIGGTMGTASYVLLGTELGMQKSFGSACHGAGRRMSRHAAARKFRAGEITNELRNKGIIIKGHSRAGISEEAPEAYKDVDAIAEIMHSAGIATKVSRLTPLVVIKG